MEYQKRILQGIIKNLINNDNVVVIDTETTGLSYADEIISIAVLNTNGDVLLTSLVKPSRPIPAAATEINNITDEMVANAPTWAWVYPRLMEVLGGKKWLGWKSEFDARMITQTCQINGLYDDLPPAQLLAEYERIHGSQIDAKRIYSEWYGEPDRERGGFVRQHLANAALQMGVNHDNAHQAIADCYAVIGVLQRASGWIDSEDLVLAQLLDSLPNVASLESLAGQQLLVLVSEVAQKLGVENAVMLRLLTAISENHLEYLSEGEGCMMAGVPLDYVSEINTYVSRDVNAENPFPASDVIHDTLRAEGIEQWIASRGGRWNGTTAEAKEFVRQLRESKEVQS